MKAEIRKTDFYPGGQKLFFGIPKHVHLCKKSVSLIKRPFFSNNTMLIIVIRSSGNATYTIQHVLAEVLKRGRFALCQTSDA